MNRLQIIITLAVLILSAVAVMFLIRLALIG